jgi:phage I-like protein
VVLAGREAGGEALRGLSGEAGGRGLEAQVVAALNTRAGRVPDWVRLLPLGEVPLGDDREPLWVDREALAALVAHFRERGLDLVVDYEYQTLSGRKAPAAGWIRELEIRIAGETPGPQDGLWARVEWTDTARQHLAAREYRYFSPVLRLEEGTRRPLALLHAALTNTPAINGLAPLVAKSRSQEQRQIPPNPPLEKGGGYGKCMDDIPLNPPWEESSQQSAVSSQRGGAFWEAEGQIPQRSSQQLAVSSQWGGAFGDADIQIPPNPPLEKGGIYGEGIDDIPPDPPLEKGGIYGQGERSSRPEAFSSQTVERGAGDAGLAGELREDLPPLGEVAVLLGLPADAGLARIRGAVLALKGNLEHLQGVQEKLAALQGELAGRVVREEVDAAIAAGKIQPCQKDSALRYAGQDLEGFRSFVENALPQAPLGRLSLGPDSGEEQQSDRGLTPQQLLICESLGLAPEAFKAREAHLKQEKLL